MEFKRIELSCAERLRELLRCYRGGLCDISPANILFWRDYYEISLYDGEDGFALRYGNMDSSVCYYAPPNADVVDKILELEGGKALFTCLSKDEVALFRERFKCGEPYHERDWDDYIYLAEELVSLRGKKFNGQRNHINKFRKLYGEPDFREIALSDIPALKEFIGRYFAEKRAVLYDESFDYEEEHLYEQLDNLGLYAQRTGILSVDGAVVGFSVGEAVGDTLIIHTEKADVAYEGVYPTLVNLFAAAHSRDVSFINREEDCGVDGLRRSKLSYHPLAIKEKFALPVVR